MILFGEGSWAVVTQTVTRKGEEVQLPCRLVQHAPPTERPDGSQYFPRLGRNAFFQVTVQDVHNSEIIKVKFNPGKGKGLRVTYPDKKIKANWWDTIPNVLVKGTNTSWMGPILGQDHLRRQFGGNITEFILGLITETIAKSQQRKKAA